MSEHPQLLVHDHKDNVGVVVVENLSAGTEMLCVVTADNSSFRLTCNDDVPIGHKVALKDIANGDVAVKYGEDIGRFKADVKKGGHVHVHNLKTNRW
ncbi:UxaA family hydrolase [Jiella sp. MQZ9-1]|uniref:UxaA family hydrolase n=1 Tax=Jiella flava TaxID=2816857 RepID=A0A939JVN9_9HYPH|nr:UxaA family hydrolase [Jiella flava]MBO0664415.1 UxaA family hydrolase [Jiella flava]MCD2473051.1 UxaA family hydrolase [Jiella flava]